MKRFPHGMPGQCWESWLDDLPKLSSFTVRRCLRPSEFGQDTSNQLHHFADASEAGYGCVSYLGSVSDEGKICRVFLFAKSRVAPLKTISIPRLELSVRHDNCWKESWRFHLTVKKVFWSDSMSVLRSVKNETKRFHTFLANRVSVIRDGSTSSQWQFVDGSTNPGDLASRSLSAETLLSSKQWLMGPEFLWRPEADWPQNPVSFGNIPVEDHEMKSD